MTDWNNTLYKTLLNAIPLPIFIVNDDVRVHDLNEAAEKTYILENKTILNRRGGEVLKCLNSMNDGGGCGRGEECKNCVIRNSVTESIRGHSVSRRHTRVILSGTGSEKEYELLITAAPLASGNENLVLLIIEDISEFTTLKNILPICSRCKKIRDDSQYWHTVEEYLNKYTGVDFTHGICPDCIKILYPDYIVKKKEEK